MSSKHMLIIILMEQDAKKVQKEKDKMNSIVVDINNIFLKEIKQINKNQISSQKNQKSYDQQLCIIFMISIIAYLITIHYFSILYQIQMILDYYQLLQCFQRLNANQIQYAENRLKTLAHSPIQFVTHLTNILCNNVEHKIKYTISVYLSNYLIELLDEIETYKIFEIICTILKNCNIGFQYKNKLQKTIVHFLTHANKRMIQDWINLVKLMVMNNNQQSGYMIMNSFGLAQICEQQFIIFFRSTFEFTFRIIYERILEKNLKDLKIWTQSLISLLRKLCKIKQRVSEHNRKLFKQICENNNLVDLITNIYCIEQYQINYIENNQTLIKLKLLFTEIYQIIFIYYLKYKFQFHLHKLLFENMIQIFIKSFIQISTSNQNNKQQYQQLLVNIIKILIVAVKNRSMYQIFEPFSINLIEILIIYHLQITKNQINLFQNDHEEYIKITQDICQNQKIISVKSKAAQLLEGLVNFIDGSLNNLVRLILSEINQYSMKQNNVQYVEQKNHFKIGIQKSFLILSILHIAIKKRKDLEMMVKNTILNNIRLLNINELQINRVFMFLSYNIQWFQESFQTKYQFIRFAIKYNGYPVNNLIMLDFIFNLLDDHFQLPIFDAVINKITNTQLNFFWQMLEALIKSNKKLIPVEYMNKISECILTKIKNEIQKDGRMISNKHIIFKCLNIVMEMYDKDEQLQQWELNIQMRKVANILMILSNRNQNIFDDEMVKIINILFRRTKVINQSQFQIFQLLSKIIQQNQFIFGEIFNTISIFINNYTSNRQNQQIIYLLRIILNGLITPHQEYYIAQNLLLLQQFIIKYRHILSQNTFNLIIQTTNRIYNHMHVSTTINRIINLQLLVYPFWNTNQTNQIIKRVLQKEQEYKNYEIKVLVYSLCTILQMKQQIIIKGQAINIITRTLNRYKKELLQCNDKKKNKNNKNYYQQTNKLFEKSIQKLNFFIKDLDIFTYFNRQLQQYKQSNPTEFGILINRLTQQTIINLKQITNYVYIGNARKIIHISKNQQIICSNLMQAQQQQSSDNQFIQEQLTKKKRYLNPQNKENNSSNE